MNDFLLKASVAVWTFNCVLHVTHHEWFHAAGCAAVAGMCLVLVLKSAERAAN